MITLINNVMILMTLVLGGTVAIGLFLWLATFSRNDINLVGGSWLTSGLIGAGLYISLVTSGISRGGPTVAFGINLLAGLLLLTPIAMLEPTNKRMRGWVLYVPWAYFWIAGCIGWRSSWLGLATITLPALLIAGGGLFFVAGFLLPRPELELHRGERAPHTPGSIPMFNDQIQDFVDMLRYPQNKSVQKEWFEYRRKVLRCLLTYTLGSNYAYYVLVDEKITDRTEDSRTWLTGEERVVKRVDGDPFGAFLSGPGLVLTGCDHAVALSSGLRFKGAKGPGVVFTGMSDAPTQALDLRVQLRAFPVTARTKDGIEVKVTTFIPFQMGAGGQRPELGQGYPYRASDVFRAIHAQPMDHKDETQSPDNLEALKWYDLPQLAGERIMREILSRYNFDDLYAPFDLYPDPKGDPRARIAQELRDELDKVLPTWGIQRIGGGISNIEPMDPRVIQQRIEAWQADWARQVMLKRAAGHATRIQLIEQARAQAQVDIIRGIGQRIEELRSSGESTTPHQIVQYLTEYFIDALEQLAVRGQVRRLLPGDTDRVLQSARRGAGTSYDTNPPQTG
jgi:hypothetical protein